MTPWILHLLSAPLGWVYATSLEWLVHRFIFHALGKRFRRIGFHWYQHHRDTLKYKGADPSYHQSAFGWNPHGREVWGLIALGILHIPLLSVTPLFTIAAIAGGVRYARFHRRCHVDPEWCRVHAPWHWDHHMGKNPDANWCVTSDWLDRLVGTRVLGPASLGQAEPGPNAQP